MCVYLYTYICKIKTYFFSKYTYNKVFMAVISLGKGEETNEHTEGNNSFFL